MQRLRLGTRGSLLALAQSRLVAATLIRQHPELAVELVPVSTPGDRNLATPLQDVSDPDFFSADLDDALLAGTVDFCVHSLKDLPADRPAGIARAALPARENPRDVIVWRAEVTDRLAAGETLRLGSCSVRRQRNVGDFLKFALPATGSSPVLEFLPLRGPVDARLAPLHLPRTAPGALDGVVLALAGLSRLWNDPAGRAVLEPLLKHVRWTVLPLAGCPAAAGQGALAIECRATDVATLNLLRELEDPDTVQLVRMEQTALRSSATSDQQALGATAIRHATLGPLCYVRGSLPTGVVERLDWSRPPPPGNTTAFDGIAWQRSCTRRPAGPIPQMNQLGTNSALFVAYWHALEHHAVPADARLWVSGVESWRRLAARGLWIEGCGDNLGFSDVRITLECPVLGLPPLRDWTALTYSWAVPGWRDSGIGRVLTTYDILAPIDDTTLDKLRDDARQATHFYWSSAEQFHALRTALPANAHHACGAGKTLHALQAAGVEALPFPNGREWQRWIAS